MKKTVNINLAGIIFHIDEDAYEKLNAYLGRVKKHYKDEEGCEEIASDIEARIAELFQIKNSGIININHVDEIISILGEPEVYEQELKQEEEINLQKNTSKRKKRIYRDSDNEIIGGVCSGIAAYFSIDPVIVRLIFLVSLITGSGIVIYFILWAIIPEAKTTAQKLQMKGEKVTAENIKKTIQKELDSIKKNVGDLENSDEANQFKQILKNIASFFVNIFKYIIKFIGKFIGGILLMLGLFMSLIIFSNLFGSSDSLININGNRIHPFNLNDYFPLIISDIKLQGITVFGLFLFIGVPVAQLIWISIRILFNTPKQSTTVRTMLTGIWIMGLTSLLYVASQTSSNFSNNTHVTESVVLDFSSDTVYIDLNDNPYFNTHQESPSYLLEEELKSLLCTDVTLDIQKSNEKAPVISIDKFASGHSQKEAKVNASNIHYDFSVSDDEIYFDNYFGVDEKDGFRLQSVAITLYIPEGMTVYLDANLKHFIYDIENTSNTYDTKMINRYWKMAREGLTCLDCDF